MTIDDARSHIGDRVTYRGIVEQEEGAITSVGRQYVFVQYDGDKYSCATNPADLELLPAPIR